MIDVDSEPRSIRRRANSQMAPTTSGFVDHLSR
jgi:hypothetical protein